MHAIVSLILFESVNNLKCCLKLAFSLYNGLTVQICQYQKKKKNSSTIVSIEGGLCRCIFAIENDSIRHLNLHFKTTLCLLACVQFSSNLLSSILLSSNFFRPIHFIQSYQVRLGLGQIRLGLDENRLDENWGHARYHSAGGSTS